jgi:hypothetical protein
MAVRVERRGHCLCGAIRYRVTGEPIYVAHCHCESCRRASSAALVTWAGFRRDDFAFTAGDPTAYRSSPGVVRRFCRRCGSPLTYESVRWSDQVHVQVCSFEDPAAFRPTQHVHTAEQLPWLQLADGLERSAGSG